MNIRLLRPRTAGFSLVELLVVCSIIAIVVGFTIPAATTLMRGSQITQASQLLADQIGLARQMAIARNRAVEVRFYKFGDPETPGEKKEDPETGRFRAFQLFEVTANGVALPLDKIQHMPNAVIMNEGELSSLLNKNIRKLKTPTEIDPELPRAVKRNYVYFAFRFQADGSTDLPPTKTSENGDGKWYITIHSNSLPPDLDKVRDPKGGTINFFTVQVDPVNGSTRTYRPTAG